MFTPRTFDQILSDYIAAVQEAGSGLIDLNPSSPFYVLARSNSSVIADLESRLVDISRSISPITATGSDLDSLMFIPLLTRTLSSRSQGTIIIKPTPSVVNIPINTVLTDLDSGLQFFTTVQSSTSTTLNTFIPVESFTTGFSNNLPAGTSLFSPVFPTISFFIGENLTNNNIFIGDFFGGRDEESDDSLRTRFFSALTSVDRTSTINHIKNVVSSYPSINKSFVKNRLPGIIELWVRFFSEDGLNTFLQEDVNALKDYLLEYIPAGITLSINEAKIKYFPLSISIIPYSSSDDLTSLNSDISSAINNVIAELDIGQTLSLSSLVDSILPFVAKVSIIEPVKDVVPLPDEVVIVSSIKMTVPSY